MNVQATGFWQWLSTNGMSPGYQAELVTTAMLTIASVIVLVVTIVSFTVYKVQRNRLTDALKRDLLERGMSAEDIVDVVRAVPAKNCGRREFQ